MAFSVRCFCEETQSGQMMGNEVILQGIVL